MHPVSNSAQRKGFFVFAGTEILVCNLQQRFPIELWFSTRVGGTLLPKELSAISGDLFDRHTWGEGDAAGL